LSFAQLIYEITALGAWLRTQELGPGDRIALVAPWGPETALAILAIASNAVCVPINPRLTRFECGRWLRESRSIALYDAGGKPNAARESAEQLGLPILSPPFPFRKPHGRQGGCGDVDVFMPRVAPDDPALVMSTSGTTGRPKIVPITHRQLLARGEK